MLGLGLAEHPTGHGLVVGPPRRAFREQEILARKPLAPPLRIVALADRVRRRQREGEQELLPTPVDSQT